MDRGWTSLYRLTCSALLGLQAPRDALAARRSESYLHGPGEEDPRIRSQFFYVEVHDGSDPRRADSRAALSGPAQGSSGSAEQEEEEEEEDRCPEL